MNKNRLFLAAFITLAQSFLISGCSDEKSTSEKKGKETHQDASVKQEKAEVSREGTPSSVTEAKESGGGEAKSSFMAQKTKEINIAEILDRIYANTTGKISDEEKDKIEAHKTSATYGEVKPEGMIQILYYLESLFPELFTNRDNVYFSDIGSGRALVPVGFALLTGWHCSGIEISESRHKVAVYGLENLGRFFPQYEDVAKSIRVINQDALEIPFKEVVIGKATPKNPQWLFWISSLCFPDDFMVKLAAKMEKELPNGTIIVTSKALPIKDNDRIQLIEITHFKMTWTDKSKTHIYYVDKPKSKKVAEYRSIREKAKASEAKNEELSGLIDQRLGADSKKS